MGRKLVREKRIVAIRWTSVLSADRMRPSRFSDPIVNRGGVLCLHVAAGGDGVVRVQYSK